MLTKLRSYLPDMNLENIKLTALINAYSALQIPLLGFITPRVIELTGERAVVRVRLDRRTRNHLGVMYFGALAMGAELSIALKAIQTITAAGKRIDFIFKDFSAQFLKRADGPVDFICDEAAEVKALIDKATRSDERLNATFNGRAVISGRPEAPVMTYTLTLSVKRRT